MQDIENEATAGQKHHAQLSDLVSVVQTDSILFGVYIYFSSLPFQRLLFVFLSPKEFEGTNFYAPTD